MKHVGMTGRSVVLEGWSRGGALFVMCVGK